MSDSMSLLQESKKAIIGVVFLVCVGVLLFVFLQNGNVENNSETKLASRIFSRSKIGNVEAFKDQGIMHGPIYFYFRASESEIDRLVHWFGMEPKNQIDKVFTSLFDYAEKETNWDINWSTENTFAIYYCNAKGSEWGFDILLFDGTKAVYATSGFIGGHSRPTFNLDSCVQ
ncbi:MAG: hypothetical protein GY731_07970 [Gammaproteobacteria bacterium]|nr:hypothetical protein [Gammaproteobacteria bacterium]